MGKGEVGEGALNEGERKEGVGGWTLEEPGYEMTGEAGGGRGDAASRHLRRGTPHCHKQQQGELEEEGKKEEEEMVEIFVSTQQQVKCRKDAFYQHSSSSC